MEGRKKRELKKGGGSPPWLWLWLCRPLFIVGEEEKRRRGKKEERRREKREERIREKEKKNKRRKKNCHWNFLRNKKLHLVK